MRSLPIRPRDVAAATFLAALGFAHLSTTDLGAQVQNADWAQLAKYRAANAALPAVTPGEHRVVFMGNSITELWAPHFDSLFPGKPYVGRGISGQTTPQMLVRFRQDVIALKPSVVVLLGGTNDIAGNTGPSTLEMIEDNLASMTDVARANGVRVVLVSVLPAADYPWRRGLDPGAQDRRAQRVDQIVCSPSWRRVSGPARADGG